jgi:lysophospholipase L1-like esterase
VTSAARIALSTAIGLFVFEIALRIYNPLPFRVHGTHIVLPYRQSYTFHVGRSSKLDETVHHTKNSIGFRGPEPPRDWDRRLTVMTVGGSTTECLFLSDGRTWTDAFARRLAATRDDVWVNNAGLDGQSTFGHLVLMRDVIGPMRPNVVLFLIGINDVARDRANTYDVALSDAPASPLRSAIDFAADHLELAALAQNLMRVRHAREAGFGHNEIDLQTARHVPIEPDAMDRVIETHRRQYVGAFADRVSQLVAMSRANGIEPVLITQPALFGDGVDPTTCVDLRTVQSSGGANGLLDWRLLELYNDATRRVGAASRVGVIDLARELPKDSRYFYDFMHFSNEGAQLVGDIVFDAFARSVLPDQK